MSAAARAALAEPADGSTVAVLDVDGVLADVRHRLHHVERTPKDWGAFFAAMDADGPLEVGIELARLLDEAGHGIVYLTGRQEAHRGLTERWMREQGLPEGRLVMRPSSDRRPARQFKPSALRRIAASARVVVVVDDDDAVVRVLAQEGWPVVHATWMHAGRSEQQTLFDAQEAEGLT
ncbi:MAG: hypothetical protein GC157_01535 [Frankiales bacterium]|nr:hypothetical protein [Frankiales bacterium]